MARFNTAANDLIVSWQCGKENYHPYGTPYRLGERVNDEHHSTWTIIYDGNTPIGYFVETDEVEEYTFYNFLVLTEQNFKSQPNFKTHKRWLARAANAQGIFVVFVPHIDILDGSIIYTISDVDYDKWLNDYYKMLNEIASISQDEEVKTACLVECSNEPIDYNERLCMSYNQVVEYDGETMFHAEDVCSMFLKYVLYRPTSGQMWVSLLEPCKDCLQKMLDSGAQYIYYGCMHKPKWDTAEYIQLRMDLRTGRRVVYQFKQPRIKLKCEWRNKV